MSHSALKPGEFWELVTWRHLIVEEEQAGLASSQLNTGLAHPSAATFQRAKPCLLNWKSCWEALLGLLTAQVSALRRPNCLPGSRVGVLSVRPDHWDFVLWVLLSCSRVFMSMAMRNSWLNLVESIILLDCSPTASSPPWTALLSHSLWIFWSRLKKNQNQIQITIWWWDKQACLLLPPVNRQQIFFNNKIVKWTGCFEMH